MSKALVRVYDRIDRIPHLVADLNTLQTKDLARRRQSDEPAPKVSPTG